jgi:hypothetical protein
VRASSLPATAKVHLIPYVCPKMSWADGAWSRTCTRTSRRPPSVALSSISDFYHKLMHKKEGMECIKVLGVTPRILIKQYNITERKTDFTTVEPCTIATTSTFNVGSFKM